MDDKVQFGLAAEADYKLHLRSQLFWQLGAILTVDNWLVVLLGQCPREGEHLIQKSW